MLKEKEMFIIIACNDFLYGLECLHYSTAKISFLIPGYLSDSSTFLRLRIRIEDLM